MAEPDPDSKIAEQFRGLPIEQLIGAPLKAASDAQIMLAQSLTQFIEQVGLVPQPKNAPPPPPGTARATQQIGFSMTRPLVKPDGAIKEEHVELSVPLLSIVPIPNLQVDNVTVDFEMNVHSQLSTESGRDIKAGMEAGASGGMLFWKAEVKIHGEVAQHQEQTRTSDASARYRIHVEARQRPASEGMLKVLDILNTACAPRRVWPVGGELPAAAGASGINRQ